eukprot:TRINITY_DN6503_c0_g1_i3.p3 TRINITY_DN6503_c0_g1~~TRINITY_DN6503_c0_g1_i3.p3  ORF type:complete len:234 (+),score=9.90 TRINITY_DN6503_c0_g1_i3:73-702(+)
MKSGIALTNSFATKLGHIWRKYEQQLHTHPLRTQMITTGGIYLLGDTCAQQIEGTKLNQLNKNRLKNTWAYATFYEGPSGHYWYLVLDLITRKMLQPSSIAFIGAKIFADTVIMGPVHVAMFFTSMKIGEGGGWKEVKQKLYDDFWPTFTAECCFWIPFQTLNFWKIPVRHQLLAVNLGVLFESIFLCWAQSQSNWWMKVKTNVYDALK